MIIANFCHGRTEVSVYDMWQYDYGQKIRIQGLDLPTAVEVHFSLNVTGGESVTRIGVTRDRVTEVVVPDSMLVNNDATHDYWLYAFIYVANSESGQTEYKISLRVKSRPRPEAFDTPEDAELFRETIAAVNAAADRAEESENNAKESEEKAEGYLAASHTLAEQMAADKKTVTDLAGEVRENRNTVEQLASATAANAETVAEDKATVEQMAERVKSDSEKVEKDKAEVKALALEMETHAKEVASNAKQVEVHASTVAADKAQVEEKAESVSSNAETVKKLTEDVEANTEKVEKLAEDVNSNAAKVASDKEAVIDIVNNAAQKVTPYIGENGNWFIDGEDTGKPSGGVSSWNDLEDRPFYEERVAATTRLENAIYHFNISDTFDSEVILELDKTYEVIWNDTSYMCVAKKRLGKEFGTNGAHLVYVGNSELINDQIENNEEEAVFPFAYFNTVADATGEILESKVRATGAVGDVTTKVYCVEVETVLHPLDSKFLEFMKIGDKIAELFPEMEINFEETDGFVEHKLNLVEGEKYYVTWNGVEYTCTGALIEIDGYAFVILGNTGPYGGDDTGEPFVIAEAPPELCAQMGAEAMVIITPLTDTTRCKVGIKSDSEGYFVNPKYIKDMFYTEESISYVIEKFTFDASELSNGGIATETQTPLEIGKIYKLNVNGAERSYVAQDFAGAVYIGNPSGVGSTDDGFPYGFTQLSGSTEGEFLAFEKPTEGSFVVSIEGDTTTVIHTLEAKFVEGMYYEEGERKEIFPLTTAVTGESIETASFVYMPDDGMFMFSANITLDIVAGKTYMVSMNGAEYSCEAVSINIDGVPAVALGDVYTAFGGELGGIPTGEPFLIMAVSPGVADFSGMGMLLIEPPTELTFGISEDVVIHKVASKFLDLDWLPIMNATPVTKFTFDGEVNSQGLITDVNPNHSGFFEVKNGEKYMVTVNENVYECLGVASPYGSATMCYLGNMALVNSSNADTGEPFIFFIWCENGVPQSTSTLNFTEEYWETEVHMEVKGYDYAPNKMPEKYLPDPPKMYSEMIGENTRYYLYKDEALTTKLSRDEVVDLFLRGAKICILYDGELALACTPMGMEVSSDYASLTYAAGGLDLSFYSSEYTIE